MCCAEVQKTAHSMCKLPYLWGSNITSHHITCVRPVSQNEGRREGERSEGETRGERSTGWELTKEKLCRRDVVEEERANRSTEKSCQNTGRLTQRGKSESTKKKVSHPASSSCVCLQLPPSCRTLAASTRNYMKHPAFITSQLLNSS